MPRFSPRRTLALLLLFSLSYAVYRNFALLQHRVRLNVDRFRALSPSLHHVDPENPDKELVVATRSADNDDTAWLYALRGDWQWQVYASDELGDVPADKGHESIVFLSYIIDNYKNLPDIVVFTHGKRYEWFHDDPIYDIVPVLDALRFPHVFATGYVPLRCAWNPGCPAEIFPRTPISKGPPVRRDAEKNYADAWRAIFPDEPVPAVVGAPSSSHFAVTGERIRMRTLEEWERMRRWVLETKLEDNVSAKIVEYMWHIMMHMPSVYCPPASDCYCHTLGHCNITCSTGSCEGRYRLPPQTDVPEHWPREGGGKDGWPMPGWDESKGVGISPDKKEKDEKEDEEKGEKSEKSHPEDAKVTDDGRKSIPVAVQGEWKPPAREKEEEEREESDQ